jgi:glutaminyl-peptide cyclotransferase
MALFIAMPPTLLLILLLTLLTGLTAAYTPFSDASLKAIPRPEKDFDIHNGALLAPILIPRVPGTPGSTKVLNHLTDFFKNNLPKWEITYQNSTQKTPATGDKLVPFVNMMVTRDPPWAKEGEVERLVIVAHYDSKYTPKDFIGATDSAAPVAMMMHAARSLDESLTKKWEAMEKSGDAGNGLEVEKGVMFLFLDGEESFITWTNTDSLYGARYAPLLFVQH